MRLWFGPTKNGDEDGKLWLFSEREKKKEAKHRKKKNNKCNQIKESYTDTGSWSIAKWKKSSWIIHGPFIRISIGPEMIGVGEIVGITHYT